MAKVDPFDKPVEQEPEGPVWEQAKEERLWVTYELVDTGKAKPEKHPRGDKNRKVGWPEHLMTYDEAMGQKARRGHDGIGYLPKPGSAMVVIDFDGVLNDKETAAKAHPWLENAGYWELSASGTGYHCLMPRPEDPDSDWHRDGVDWVGYLGAGKTFCAFTFQNVAGDVIEPVPGLYDFVKARRQRDTEDRERKSKHTSGRDQWWLYMEPTDLRDLIQDILDHIDLDPKGDRRTMWLDIGMALKATNSPYAEDLWVEWSRSQPGYESEDDCRSNWARMHPDGRVLLPTAIHHAKSQGFDVRPHQQRARLPSAEDLQARMERFHQQQEEHYGYQQEVADNEPPRFTLPVYLPRKIVTTLYGSDGLGKSNLALDLAMCLATKRKCLNQRGDSQAKVLFLSVEDPRNVLLHRMGTIARHRKFADKDWDLLDQNLITGDFVGEDVKMVTFDSNHQAQATAFCELVEAIATDSQVDLIVLDPISDVYADEENVRQRVVGFMRRMERIAVKADAALLLIGHPARSEGSTYAGSGAWSSKSRSRLWMYEDDEGFIYLEHHKSSWGKPAEPLTFEMMDDGYLRQLDEVDVSASKHQQDVQVMQEIFEAILQLAAMGFHTNLKRSEYKLPLLMNRQLQSATSADVIMRVAGEMVAKGQLTYQRMDGEDGRPKIVDGKRRVQMGLWKSG